jgi:acetyltransferase-like isoleucine patch superfamily enzyme
MRTDPVAYVRMLGVHLGSNVHIYGIMPGVFGPEPWLIRIGDNVHITFGVGFVTHDGGTLILRDKVPDLEWTAPIEVQDNVYIGLYSMIMPGVTIGHDSIIGAGSIVTRSIPPGSVAVGVPARVIKTTEEYLENMKNKSLHCGQLKIEAKDKVLREIYSDFINGGPVPSQINSQTLLHNEE